MGLLTPWFLLGGIALAIPVLLHLVQRPEPSGRPFPSLMFLRRIPFKSRRRKTLRDLVLLALRCLALVLLALAFTGPYLLGDTADPPAAAGTVDRVFLIDRSYSMADPGRWDAAVDAVSERIDGLVGDERAIEAGVRRMRDAGATDLLAATFPAGDDPRASVEATRALLSELTKQR